MTMKKILITTICLTFTAIAFAQKTTTPKAVAKKPTKEETIDWIGGKMKENLGTGREFISFKDGKFTYKKLWKVAIYCTTTIDLNKVTGINSEYSKDFYISGKELSPIVCDDANENKTAEYMSISGPNYNKYGAPFNFTPDQALVERMKKAFATLIEYNSDKKKEGESF